MSKKTKETNTESQDAETSNAMDFSVPEEMSGRMQEAEISGDGPTFQPGQEGFMPGATLSGLYKGTKRIYSDKFNNPKIEEGTGREYRDRHVFEHPKAGYFGIWSVGTLAFVLRKVDKNKFIAITYKGLGPEPLKKGQSKPHVFEFRGENLKIDTNEFEDIYDAQAAAKAAGANHATGEVLNEAMPN
jgi:hypothetical protein